MEKKIEIDQQQFEKLCSLQCSIDEIADFFDCSIEDIGDWCQEVYKEDFSVVFKKKSIAGKIALRRAQFKLAEKNANMAMWLGKQYLDQSDDEQKTGAQVTSLDDIRKKLKMIE